MSELATGEFGYWLDVAGGRIPHPDATEVDDEASAVKMLASAEGLD